MAYSILVSASEGIQWYSQNNFWVFQSFETVFISSHTHNSFSLRWLFHTHIILFNSLIRQHKFRSPVVYSPCRAHNENQQFWLNNIKNEIFTNKTIKTYFELLRNYFSSLIVKLSHSGCLRQELKSVLHSVFFPFNLTRFQTWLSVPFFRNDALKFQKTFSFFKQNVVNFRLLIAHLA